MFWKPRDSWGNGGLRPVGRVWSGDPTVETTATAHRGKGAAAFGLDKADYQSKPAAVLCIAARRARISLTPQVH